MIFGCSGNFVAAVIKLSPLSIIMFRDTDHTQSGWLGFFRHRRENPKARQCLNHCVCDRVRSTRSVYKQPPGLKTPNNGIAA
jgi:hypothetical protein